MIMKNYKHTRQAPLSKHNCPHTSSRLFYYFPTLKS